MESTIMEKLTYEQQYTIRSYEPRPDGHVAITSPCNHLQDIASRHAETLGFGFHDLEATGHVWVLARLHLRMQRLFLRKIVTLFSCRRVKKVELHTCQG